MMCLGLLIAGYCNRRYDKMSEDIYSQYLRWTVTESAAATFTGGSAILTGASVARIKDQNIALEIHAISCQAGLPDIPAAGAIEYVQVAISTRDDLTAMPTMDDEHVVYLHQQYVRGGVATYVPLIQSENRYMPPFIEFKHPLLISHTKLYPYIQSTNAAAQTVNGFILFTYVLLSDALAIEALEAYR